MTWANRRRSIHSGRRPSVARVTAVVVLAEGALFSIITPLLPRYAEQAGLGATGISLLVSLYLAASVVLSLPSGWLIQRMGARLTLLLGLGILAVATAGFGFAADAGALFVLRAVQGIGAALAWGGAISWLLASTPSASRGEALGRALGAAFIGMTVGPLLGGAVLAFGDRGTLLVCALAVVAIAVWASRLPEHHIAVAEHHLLSALRPSSLWRPATQLLLVAAVVGALLVLMPLRLDAAGASGWILVLYFASVPMLLSLYSPVAGRLSDRHGRAPTLMVGYLVLVVSLLLLGAAPSLVPIVVLGALTSLASDTLFGPLFAWVADVGEDLELGAGATWTATNLTWSTGLAAGGFAAGPLASTGTLAGATVALALVPLAAAVLLGRDRRPARATRRR